MRPANLTQAFYQGAWLPCRILDEEPDLGTVEVRVVDRTGSHDVWVVAEHVRGRTRPMDGARGTPPRGESH